MRRLLCYVVEIASSDKDLVKELKRMGEHLTAIDKQPDLEVSQDQAHLILGKCCYLSLCFLVWQQFKKFSEQKL